MKIDPAWMERREEVIRTDHESALYGVRFPEPDLTLSGDQVSLHHAFAPGQSAGRWILWTARGPLYLTQIKFRLPGYLQQAQFSSELDGSRWIAAPDPDLCEPGNPIYAWIRETGLAKITARTREELIRVIRSQL